MGRCWGICPIFAIGLFFFNDTATTEIYTLSLHDALPISQGVPLLHLRDLVDPPGRRARPRRQRSEEHTSELQSRRDLVCRLLLEKKKKHTYGTRLGNLHDLCNRARLEVAGHRGFFGNYNI